MIKVKVYSETESFYKTLKSWKSLQIWLRNHPDFEYDHLTLIIV